MTRAVRWWLVPLMMVALLGGCGIPDDTAVVPRGLGPSTGRSSGEEPTRPKATRTETNDRAQFVKNYLEAAAGGPDDQAALDDVREFLAPKAAESFKPGQSIRVVRRTEEPLVNLNTGRVSLGVQPVGTLGANGILEPSDSDGTVTRYTFEVQEQAGRSGLFITQAPPYLLLDAEALNSFYTRRAIYFWNRDHTSLVPDLRYLPVTVPSEQQPTQIIEWLVNAPAPWLVDDAVDPLPQGTKQLSNVPAGDGEKLQINLSGQAVPADDSKAALDRLGRQLMWSLRPNLARTLELQIDGQVVGDFTGDDYLTSNAAYRLTSPPEQFCVYEGRIRRLAQSANSTAPIPVIPDSANRDVQTAAMSSTGSTTYAAVVAGRDDEQELRVGAAATGVQATMRRIALRGPIGRPTWAVTPDSATQPGNAVGLIPSDGHLYSFGPRPGDGPREAEWPGAPAGITAVSVAPDGHRIAVLAGGRLYMAVMTSGGDGMQLSAPRPIHTLLRDLTAVDWGSESSLVLAGTHADTDRIAIAYVSIDGAQQNDRLADLGTAKVTELAAYPANPVSGSDDPAAVAYVADGAAYNVLKDPDRIEAANLAGPAPSGTPTARPTAPFFLN